MVRRIQFSIDDPRFSSPDWVENLAARIDRQLPRPVTFSPETARILPMALRAWARHTRAGTYWLEGAPLAGVIQREELLASGKSIQAMRAGFDALVLAQPDWLFTLKKGAWTVSRSHPEARSENSRPSGTDE